MIAELMHRISHSRNPRITQVYLPDDEYNDLMREADKCALFPIPEALRHPDYRVKLCGAVVYRLREIGSSKPDS